MNAYRITRQPDLFMDHFRILVEGFQLLLSKFVQNQFIYEKSDWHVVGR